MPDWVLTRQQAIGQRIRDRRLYAGLSQVELGERIGRDHKTIHRWESAATAPSLIDLLLVADAVGVPIAELVG